jgi:histidinol-phosphate aminotransferase
MHRLVPPHIERLVPYQPGKPVEELEREYGVRDAVKLASNENPLGPSPRALEALRGVGASLCRYPDAAAWYLREALSRHHDVPMEEIAIGNGSNELIDLACRTFAGPGDHAVIGVPSFVCYRLGLLSANVDFTEVPLRDHLAWDVDALLAAVRPETRLLFLANPNNPTGAYVGRVELERLLRALPERVVAVIDEAYVEFADAPDYATALDMRGLHERTLVLRTFSKAHGLAALRVGYGIGTRAMVEYLDRVRAPFNCNALGQLAARAAITDTEHVQRYVEMNRTQRARLTSELSALGLRVAPSQANFVLADVGVPGKEVYEKLLRRGVIVRPMPPPIGSWLRITVGLPSENDRLLAALRDSRGSA